MSEVLKAARVANKIAINPYTFEAGKGPGIDTVDSIIAIAKIAGCSVDPGVSGGPIFLKGLPQSDDDLRALLELAQIA